MDPDRVPSAFSSFHFFANADALLLRGFDRAVEFGLGVVLLALPLGLKNRIAAIDSDVPVARQVLCGNPRVSQFRKENALDIRQPLFDFRPGGCRRHFPQLGYHFPGQIP